jgi:hypothetical protein
MSQFLCDVKLLSDLSRALALRGVIDDDYIVYIEKHNDTVCCKKTEVFLNDFET